MKISGKKMLVLCIVIALFGYYRYSAWQAKVEMTARFTAFMPHTITPEGYVMQAVHVGLFDALMAGGCGTEAIRITDETAAKINHDGLAFFETAQEGRETDASGRKSQFKNWQKLPDGYGNSLGDSLLMVVFNCAGTVGIPKFDILDGLKGGNSYSNISGMEQTFVLPDQKLFFHIFFH